MGKLNLNFSYSFNGKIWNIISHPEKELLLLEVREDDKFQVNFNLLDTSSGEFLFKGLNFEENWWIGASFVTDDIILFYTFPDQDNPDVKHVFAYDFHQKEILWKKERKNIIEAADEVLLMDADSGDMTRFDLRTGEALVVSEHAGKVENDTGLKENKMLKKAFHYREGNEYFDTVRQFLVASANLNIVKGVDYYEDDHIMVMSFYYLNKNNKLANDLLVVDLEGNHLLYERLGNDLSGISDDTFFIYSNKLIFVKDNADFLIYQLS